MSIKLKINGAQIEYHGDPRTSLLNVMRNQLHLTGAKPVCEEGFCGACTVHLDGAPIAACLKPVGLVGDAEITTIEGISGVEKLTQIQQALQSHDVVQCGMCFPGMVMALDPFIQQNPTPTRAEIKIALAGNICRCTGYERIIDAIMSLQEPAGAAS